MTAETCPHYLTLAAEVADGATAAKVGPPIREERTRSRSGGICRRNVDMIVSDHSPARPR